MNLIAIQNDLKAPKGQENTFAHYSYRNCEDILEAVKPILLEHECSIKLRDEIVQIGDRYYVKATATIKEQAKPENTEKAHGFARECLTKKGMDEAQITGSASSYARKYALNGLFAIDDTKDADPMDNTASPELNPKAATPAAKKAPAKPAMSQAEAISMLGQSIDKAALQSDYNRLSTELKANADVVEYVNQRLAEFKEAVK